MEDGLVHIRDSDEIRQSINVLILIVMEDGLVHQHQIAD